MNDQYRVNLDIYNGPLDLLLYLIRRDEVEIYDIPIAGITEQYLKYVELLKGMDPNLAGEFMVLAATLLEIKTRMLLPRTAPEEQGAEDLEIDPRADLVRQLLEYKAFKDAAGDLRSAADQRAMRFGRRPAQAEPQEKQLDLEDVQIWDLFDAFSGIMEAVGRQVTEHEVIYDDTPIELYATDLLDRLRRDGALTFRQVFQGRASRGELVGLFLAMLELIKQSLVLVSQERNFDEILLRLNPSPPETPETKNTEAESGAYVSDSSTDAEGNGDDAETAGA